MTTILELQGYETIQFGIDSIQSATSGYYVPANTIDLHVSEREEIIYSETRYGGNAVYAKNKLAPITFTCFVWGSTRDEMLDRSKALSRVLTTDGMVKYQPDGASIATYYDFVASSRPQTSNATMNAWDAQNAKANNIVSNAYVMALDVTVMTKPIGHSAVFETYGQELVTNSGYIDLANIVGDYPAIVRLIMKTASGQASRYYICGRSSILSTIANLDVVYEAEANDSSYGTWANQVDATRSGGNYYRSTGDSTWQGLVFFMNNEVDHRGLITFLPVVRAQNTNVEFRFAFYLNETLIYTSPDTYKPDTADKWLVLYGGEFNLPLTTVSSDFDTSNFAFVLEAKGTGNIDVDFIQLMFSDESIMEIQQGSLRADGTPDFMVVSGDSDGNRLVNECSYGASYVAESAPYRVYGSTIIQAREDTRLFFLWDNTLTYQDPTQQMYITSQIMYRTIYPFGATN